MRSAAGRSAGPSRRGAGRAGCTVCAHLDHPDVVLRGGVVALVRQELREVARVEEQRVAEQRQEGVRLALGDAARRADSVSDGKF